MFNSSLLFSINNDGRVYALPTTGSCWKEFMYLGIEFKTLSAVPHFLWAVGGDRQIYLHVHGLEIPIRVKEESYENERWLPLEGFSGRLLPTDRYHFSTQDGSKDRSIDRIRLPSMAWQWEGDWQLELTLDGQPLDHDGWSYAVDFPAQFGPVKNWKSCVRRRKWIRHRKFSAMNSWCAIAPLHKDPTQEPFVDISIGGHQMPYAPAGSLVVWAVTVHGRVMFRSGVSTTSPEGLKWINVSIPPNCDIKQISVGPTGLVWALLASGRVLIRKGVTKDCLLGETWLEVKSPEESKLSHISVGNCAVWAISNDTRVWFRKGIDGEAAGTSENAALGTGWLEVSGNMSHISVALNDQVFAIGEADKCIYWRSGVTPSELTGKRWRLVQGNMQISRTSSVASVPSSTTSQTKQHQSLTALHKAPKDLKTNINLRHSWEESHSAPIEHTLPIKPPIDTSTKTNISVEKIDLSGKSYETTLKNPRAWSPVRSVGSVVGMEAHPECDSSAFDIDSNLFYDDEVTQAAWGTCDTMWSFVEAGACTIDSLQVPNWFSDSNTVHQSDLQSNWRLCILHSLKTRNNLDIDKSLYGVTSEDKDGPNTCEARLVTVNGSYEDCILSIQRYHSENNATMTVSNPDGATLKFILNFNEVNCITSSSEPGCPRITLTLTEQKKNAIKIQFATEQEYEEWFSVLVNIMSHINGLSGRPSECSIWTITNLGDVLNWDPAVSKAYVSKNDMYAKEIQVFGKDVSNGFTTVLNNNFPPGSVIRVSGSLHDAIDRFHINLQGPEVKKPRHKIESEVTEVPFHFNMRFDQQTVVCNTKTLGNWGTEERYPLPLAPGQEFYVKIICESDGFNIILNDEKFCFFKHRLKPESINSVYVMGPLKLYNMVYSTTSAIIGPEDMIWRPMGGHLRRIECSSNGIVWGISHDHRAWVYTGRWGGGVLKDVGDKEGLHPMMDTQTYCVYENQRWNPLSGYTSTGLPTDRHMWSDITGKQKRTREHTRLLGRHWHWVSEWITDYNVLGGVDTDGWQYATDFPAPYHGKKVFTDCVRRRRWFRKAQLVTEGPWMRAGTTSLIDISLWTCKDDVTLWAITAGGDAIYRVGVTPSTPIGTSWEHVNSPQSMIAISVYDDVVWVVGRKGEVYYREGINKDCRLGNNWRLIEAPKTAQMYAQKNITNGGVKSISVTNNAAWTVLNNGSIAVRSDVTTTKPDGKTWIYLTEFDVSYKQVSAGEQEVWAVRSDGALCRRLGVSRDIPEGSAWQVVLNVNVVHVTARGSSF